WATRVRIRHCTHTPRSKRTTLAGPIRASAARSIWLSRARARAARSRPGSVRTRRRSSLTSPTRAAGATRAGERAEDRSTQPPQALRDLGETLALFTDGNVQEVGRGSQLGGLRLEGVDVACERLG